MQVERVQGEGDQNHWRVYLKKQTKKKQINTILESERNPEEWRSVLVLIFSFFFIFSFQEQG